MSSREFMFDLLQPGETILLAGKRGGGKTATAISIAQHAMAGDYGHRRVEVITNVLFGRVSERGPPMEGYPPGVHHEDTLAGTMRCIGEIIREYGSGNCLILWILDEAQNFMLADMNGSKENRALITYLGNARKFDVCNVFLTPALNNLVPRVRCFPTGDSKSGYCSAQLQKDPARASELVGRNVDPRSITFIKTDAESMPVPVYIKPTSWIRGIYSKGLEPGSYGYDTKSTAMFTVGKNENDIPFDFHKFIEATSGGLSHELPDKIDEYFSKWEEEGSNSEQELPGEDYSRIRISDQCRRIERMRELKITWEKISIIEGEPERTLGYRYDKWKKSGSPESNESSILANGEPVEGRAGADIYNPKRGPGPGGPGSPMVGGEA